MTRLWPQGIAIEVDCDTQGQPARITWCDQVHAVSHVAATWRVDLSWWRERVWRSYYKVSTDTGLLLVIFKDLDGGGWYLQRLYD